MKPHFTFMIIRNIINYNLVISGLYKNIIRSGIAGKE